MFNLTSAGMTSSGEGSSVAARQKEDSGRYLHHDTSVEVPVPEIPPPNSREPSPVYRPMALFSICPTLPSDFLGESESSTEESGAVQFKSAPPPSRGIEGAGKNLALAPQEGCRSVTFELNSAEESLGAALVQPGLSGCMEVAPESKTSASGTDWSDGVDMSAPPFSNRIEFINYCKGKLPPERQADLENLVSKDKTTKRSISDECKNNEEDALKVFFLFLLLEHTEMGIATAANKVNRKLKAGVTRVSADTARDWFFSGDPKELYAYNRLFGKGMKMILKEKACMPGPEGKNATYWLIRLMDEDNTDNTQAASLLNRPPHSVPCPFGEKWDSINVYEMLGKSDTTDNLITQLQQTHDQSTRSISQRLFYRANNGDVSALDGYIRHHHRTEKANSEIAFLLYGKVKIPGLGDNKLWRTHMIHQQLTGQPITFVKPDDYKKAALKASHKTRCSGKSQHPKRLRHKAGSKLPKKST
ncbi:MAG: hypothetical protein ACR2PT_06660 [Endozoicomonas sp.]